MIGSSRKMWAAGRRGARIGGAAVAVLGLCVSSSRLFAQSDDEPKANPSRPTVSRPANLTPVGYLQFETGLRFAHGSPEASSRFDLEYAMKLALADWAQVLVEGEPLVAASGNETREGDILTGVKLCPIRSGEKGLNVAVAYLRRVHESKAPNLDTGGSIQSGTLLVSFEVLEFHVDANGYASEQEEQGEKKTQTGESAAISHDIGKLKLTGELWRSSQPFTHSHAAGTLWAVSYRMRPNLVVDAGANFGLTSTSTKWSVFAGLTYLLPRRLW